MKQTFLSTVVFFLLFISVAQGQEPAMTLTFKGIYDGESAIPDSVDIRNRTRNCKTSIHWPDSIFYKPNVGMDDLNSAFCKLQAFQNAPNPAGDRTIVKIYVPEPEMVRIRITDFSGRTVSALNQVLKKGYHTFLFKPGKEHVYLLSVANKAEKCSIKIVAKTNSSTAECSLACIDTDVHDASDNVTGISDDFQFSWGDTLDLTGYYNSLISKISDAPAASGTYTFTFSGSVPALETSPMTDISQNEAAGGGNITSEGSASVTGRGVCWSASANPTVSGLHTTDGTGTGSFSSRLTNLNPGTTYYVRAYASNSAGTGYGNEITFTTLDFSCGSSFTIEHKAGDVAPVSRTITYGTVSDIPGEASKCWITSNLGADRQAGKVDESSEASAGWYWQFNRSQGFRHDGTTLSPLWTITAINEDSHWQSANDPCAIEFGSGWRIPTSTEWINVDAGGNWNNWNAPFGSALKIHAAGYLHDTDGTLGSRGLQGCYWSSTQIYAGGAWGLFLTTDYSVVGQCDWKADGLTLRCLRDK